MKRAPRSRQRHDLYAKYHDYDSEISDLLGECGIQPVSISLNSSNAFQATVNTEFSQDISSLATAEGGPKANPTTVEKLSWAIGNESGTLPDGLSIDAETGIIFGTPTTTGEASFEVVGSYQDEDGQQIYTINVAGEVLIIIQVSVGNYHTCAVTDHGGVKFWGLNDAGQLGNGTTASSSLPVNVSGLQAGVISVTSGSNFTCALTGSHGAKCWGAGSYGKLGNGSTTSSSTPVDVSGLQNGVASISAGDSHTYAAMTSGGAKFRGYGANGRLGNNSLTNSSIPGDVKDLADATTFLTGVGDIAAGFNHSCASLAAGGVKCWGYDSEGQVGDGAFTTTARKTAVSVLTLTSVATPISTGFGHTCVVEANGGAKCWGCDTFGQLGNGTTTSSATPISVSGLSAGVSTIVAGKNRTCALTLSGGAKCWGDRSGEGSPTPTINSIIVKTPTDAPGLASGVTSLSERLGHTCAINSSEGLKCWGLNASGQLGNGTTTTSLMPVNVAF